MIISSAKCPNFLISVHFRHLKRKGFSEVNVSIRFVMIEYVVNLCISPYKSQRLPMVEVIHCIENKYFSRLDVLYFE